MARQIEPNRSGVEATRREFLQVMIAGSSLMIGGVFLTREQAAALPGPGNTSDFADIGDSLIAVRGALQVQPHARGHAAQPRALRAAADGQGAGHRDRARDADRRRDGRRLRPRRRRPLRPARGPHRDDHGRLVDDPHDVGARAHGRGVCAPAAGHRCGGCAGACLPSRDHGEEVAGDARRDGRARELRRALRRGRRARDAGHPAPAEAVRRLLDHRHRGAAEECARDRHGRAEVHARPRRGRWAFPANASPPSCCARPTSRVASSRRFDPAVRRRPASSMRDSALPERGPVDLGYSFPESTGIAVATARHVLRGLPARATR